MRLRDRLLDWWHARLHVGGVGGVPVTIMAMERDGCYTISIGDAAYSYTARWWDTRRSIARKLNRLING